MASPAEITLKNLSGTYILNKTLSDDPDPVLSLQGIGWLIRKAIAMMPLQIVVKCYQDEQGLYHLDVEQIGAAGIKGTSEARILDGKKYPHQDHIFGKAEVSNTWIKVSDLSDSDEDEAHLKKDWLDEELVDNKVESVNGWTARQTWGFQNVNVDGETKRYYTRNIVARKKDQVKRIKFFYDYVPK